MISVAELFAPTNAHLAFYFIFGSHILANKPDIRSWLRVSLNMIMLLAFAISSFLILKELFYAVIQVARTDNLSNGDALTVNLLALLYLLISLVGLAYSILNSFGKSAKQPGAEEPPDD